MKTVFFLSLFFLVFEVKSQIYLKNNTSEPVLVVIGQSIDVGSYKGCWTTNGWYKVLPGQKAVISDATGLNPNIYYYATTSSGKEYKGDVYMLVDPYNPHNILNADKDYVQKEHPEYAWRAFRHVKVSNSPLGILKFKYTIELTY